MSTTLVTIIIPVYNQKKELKQALDSIAQQTYHPFEVIIVDDGSNDKIQNSELRIQNDIQTKLIRQENKGAPAARNRGFKEAKGEYVIFWDADVIGESHMLQTLCRALQAHPEASYSYSNFYFGWKKMPARSFDASVLRQINYIHSTSLIRRANLSENPWDESLLRLQDWDVWLTLLEQGHNGVHVPEYLFRVIPHRGGMSAWLPSFMYRTPWKYIPGIHWQIIHYETARAVIQKKHGLRKAQGE